MAKTIVGLDIGSWSIKVTALDYIEHSLISYQEFDYLEQINQHKRAQQQQEFEADETSPNVNQHEDSQGDVAGQDGHASSATSSDAHAESGSDTDDDLDPNRPLWFATLQQLAQTEVMMQAETIACNIPPDLVTFATIPVPFDDETKVAPILPSLLDARLSIPIAKLFWTFYIEPASHLSEEEHPFQARVLLVDRDDLSDYLETLRAAGVNPNRIVFTPLVTPQALYQRSAAQGVNANNLADVKRLENGESVEEATAFLELGHSFATLSILQERSDDDDDICVVAARATTHGVSNLAQHLARELSIDPQDAFFLLKSFKGFDHDYGEEPPRLLPSDEEGARQRLIGQAIDKGLRALVRELRRTLQSLLAASQLRVSRLYIYGGGARISGLAQRLGQQLGIEVAPISRSLMPLNQGVDAAASSWALAQLPIDGRLRRKSNNLRQGPFVFRGRSSYLKKQMVIAGVALFTVLLLIFGILYAKKASVTAQRDALKKEVAVNTKQLFGKEVYQKKRIKLLLEGATENGSKGLMPSKSAFDLGFDIVSVLPSDLELNVSKFEVDTKRSVIQIRGDTTDAEAVDRLVSSLETISCFKDIKKERLTNRGSRTDFELQINSDGCS